MDIIALEKTVSPRFHLSQKRYDAFTKSFALLYESWKHGTYPQDTADVRRTLSFSVQKRSSGNANTHESFDVYDHAARITYRQAVPVSPALIERELEGLTFITDLGYNRSTFAGVDITPEHFKQFTGNWECRYRENCGYARKERKEPHHTLTIGILGRTLTRRQKAELADIVNTVYIPTNNDRVPVIAARIRFGRKLDAAAERVIKKSYNDIVAFTLQHNLMPIKNQKDRTTVEALVEQGESIVLHNPLQKTVKLDRTLAPVLEIHAIYPIGEPHPFMFHLGPSFPYKKITASDKMMIDYKTSASSGIFLMRVLTDNRMILPTKTRQAA